MQKGHGITAGCVQIAALVACTRLHVQRLPVVIASTGRGNRHALVVITLRKNITFNCTPTCILLFIYFSVAPSSLSRTGRRRPSRTRSLPLTRRRRRCVSPAGRRHTNTHRTHDEPVRREQSRVAMRRTKELVIANA